MASPFLEGCRETVIELSHGMSNPQAKAGRCLRSSGFRLWSFLRG
jgi:hypothetical protein